MVDALKIRRTRLKNITLLGLGKVSAGESRYIAPVILRSHTGQGQTFPTNELVLKNLTNYVPRICSDVLNKLYLQNLEFADDYISGSQPIHMVIGADLYGSILQNGLRKGHPNKPIARNSAFGWILSGKTIDFTSKKPLGNLTEVVAHHCVSNVDLNKSLQNFWGIEEIPRVKHLIQSELECEAHFQSSHSRRPDGRYVVRLPLISGSPINIGNSLKLAERSMASLSKTCALVRSYKPVSLMFFCNGRHFDLFMLRILLECIDKILIHKSDRDYQRILWTSIPDSGPVAYRLNTLRYGTASILYLALRVIRQFVEDKGSAFPLASDVLLRQIYISDCIFVLIPKNKFSRFEKKLELSLAKGNFNCENGQVIPPHCFGILIPLITVSILKSH